MGLPVRNKETAERAMLGGQGTFESDNEQRIK
jgi:hypothetical protein